MTPGRLVASGLGSLLFFCLAPGSVAGLVPWLLTRWRFQAPLLGVEATRYLGATLAGLGSAILLDCFARFALQGRGTPAPVMPTQTLVVAGLYRFVRNPMYLGLLGTILGQALLFGSLALLGYAALAWLGVHLFVVAYEEPTLRARYGAEYGAYCAGVGRWWPRVTPWRPEALHSPPA